MKVYKKFRALVSGTFGNGRTPLTGGNRFGYDAPQIKLEGAKLAAAGFVPGAEFDVTTKAGEITLKLRSFMTEFTNKDFRFNERVEYDGDLWRVVEMIGKNTLRIENLRTLFNLYLYATKVRRVELKLKK